MPLPSIQAIGFDMGGTLEDIYWDEASRLEAANGLRQLLIERDLDPGLPVPELQAVVTAGIKTYQTWREQSEVELPPEQIWTEYVFPDDLLPRQRLAEAAEELAFFYETHFYTRCLRPEAPKLIATLRSLGFRLAVISNIMSRGIVLQKLAEYGIAAAFDPVLTSSGLGWRKPNVRIFAEMARLMNVAPAACAYVGDTMSRDVVGARRAGFGLAVQIKSFLTAQADRDGDAVKEPPDAVIRDLMEVVELVMTSDREKANVS